MLAHRRLVFAAIALLPLSIMPAGAQTGPAKGEPIYLGVSGPLTGPNAQYGAQWKQGFDLALDEINGSGGIKGRPLAYIFEDTQSDPRQSVAVAQKFVADKRIVAELGDFSSPASMAASPIYQRAKLVQFGFTNSHPDFTKGGDYMWSNSVSQADEQPLSAAFAVKRLGLKRIAVLHLNTDWGRTSKDIFVKAAKEYGAEVVATEGYLPDEKDFRSTIVRVRDAKPDGVMLISYYSDAALIARQLQQAGLKLPIVAASSVYSPKLIELGGDAVEGIFTASRYFPEDPRPEVRDFVAKFKAKYNKEPDAFNAYAYDTMILMAQVMRESGIDRQAIHDGLSKVKDVPSVIFGKATFDPKTRRVAGAMSVDLVVKDGKFTIYQGGPVVR
ncbi:branched-chain amino acid transport system substrate-binding protein [Enhydrobacter aerosaccus]|uniref:Branched-chain amino acid transport system substrate-binding protein n=1 Tax=Enhydrobacter aerosaccus TaxID=225324 RepID=A0A1T4T605_9HYPH|nr:ABC transporter substrate-binding protein [Enhydrobacter aerosaccus]SKA35833.1 branched-chain amino acid transport system substrate-binding protein [Enhydrobacter aerosaccus]